MILGAVGATTGVVARFLYELLLFELAAQMAITIHLFDSADMVGCLVLSPRGHMKSGMLHGYSVTQAQIVFLLKPIVFATKTALGSTILTQTITHNVVCSYMLLYVTSMLF